MANVVRLNKQADTEPEALRTAPKAVEPPTHDAKKHVARNMAVGFLIVLAIALIGGRIYLPYYVTDYANKTLANIPGYTGSVSDVDIALWRGAYVIHDLKILKKTKGIPVPFVDIKKTDLSIQWGALFKGAVVGDVTLYNPIVNFAVSQSGQTAQTGTDTDWTKPINDLMPLDINFLEIDNGKISYRDFSASPQVDLYINNLNARITNLRNADDKNVALPSDVSISGNSIGGGKLNVNGKMNIIKKVPDLDVRGKLESVNLPALNDYARDAAAIDFHSGSFDLYTDLKVKDGQVSGFVKPLLRDIDMVNLEKDAHNPLNLLWKSVVSVVLEIFTNHNNDQVATQIDLEGNINNPQTDFWSTLGGILHNAFVKAYSNTTKKE